MLRENLRRSRRRIVTLVGLLDEEKEKVAIMRAELRAIRRRLDAAQRAINGIGSRSD